MDILLPSAEISPPLHSACLFLLAKLISTKWRFFFPGNVLDTIFEQQKLPKIENEEVLTKILNYFIAAIISTDLTLSRNALSALLDLHKERKIFAHGAVRVKFNPPIAEAITKSLTAGQHYIIQDELIQLLYYTVMNNSANNVQNTIQQALPKKLHVSFSKKIFLIFRKMAKM